MFQKVTNRTEDEGPEIPIKNSKRYLVIFTLSHHMTMDDLLKVSLTFRDDDNDRK